MAQGDGAIRHVSSERLFVFVIFGVLTLEGDHLLVEDLAIDVTKEQKLVELQLRVNVQGASCDLGTILKDFLGFMVLGLDKRKVLGVSQVQANCIF